MQVDVQGGARPTPFLHARDVFATEFDLDRPVKVFVRDDPDQRTWTGHTPEYHVLNMSRAAATSGMARELALHEFAHMVRHEEGHSSHHYSTTEGLYLAAGGRRIERDRVAHCLQIANHMKDIYADDLTVEVNHTQKLLDFLEASLAGSLVDRRSTPAPIGAEPITRRQDPAIAAVNAAFALALTERHGLADRDHRIFDLAQTIAADAPHLPFERFRHRFRTLEDDPDESTYRRALVDTFSTYLGGTGMAAD